MKNYRTILVICFLLAAPVLLYAQTAAEIERLLETEAVSYGQAAWLVLEASGFPGSFESSSDRAFNFAVQQGCLPKKTAPQDKASLEGVSLLVMRSFGIKGGFFYSLFKNPHYAYREMVYKDIIQGRSDPQMTVSGDQLLFLVNLVLSRAEEQ